MRLCFPSPGLIADTRDLVSLLAAPGSQESQDGTEEGGEVGIAPEASGAAHLLANETE